ncbi:MAG: Sir2 family NAD-dependent protein deacetylase [Myxococcota bacterium]
MSIDPSEYRRVVVLTGAGISVASGLRPYRGPGGIWTEGGDVSLSTAEGFAKDPAGSWALFGAMRNAAKNAEPNPAHFSLAQFETACPGEVLVVTQNVDGLHQRAGSSNVVEVHGSIFRSRPVGDACDCAPFPDDRYEEGVPRCGTCNVMLRPDVVFFGEAIPVDAEWTIKKALREVDLFIAVGTSGTVSPASNYVRSAAYSGARTVYVNLEPMEPANPYFQETYLGPAEEVLPRLLSS